MNNLEIAKAAYMDIFLFIKQLEEEHNIMCDIPCFIEVDGERFFRKEFIEEYQRKKNNG